MFALQAFYHLDQLLGLQVPSEEDSAASCSATRKPGAGGGGGGSGI